MCLQPAFSQSLIKSDRAALLARGRDYQQSCSSSDRLDYGVFTARCVRGRKELMFSQLFNYCRAKRRHVRLAEGYSNFYIHLQNVLA